MKDFWIRVVSLLLIAGLLVDYNLILQAREKDEKILKLTAELEQANRLVTSGDASTAGAASYVDGTYTGEAEGFGGTVAVEVTVESGKITGVEVTSAEKEDGAYLSMAEDVISEILEAQSADVDTVSGATFSSTAIRDASAQALEKAVQP